MKFKGMWKDYKDVCLTSCAWLKKYWFPYTLICVGFGIIYFSITWISMFGWSDFKSLFKKRTDDDDWDEFLN